MTTADNSAIIEYLKQQLFLPIILHVLQNHPELIQQANQIHGQRMAGDVISMPGRATPQERVSNALKTDDLNKLTTNRTLMQVLGGGAQVLPMGPPK